MAEFYFSAGGYEEPPLEDNRNSLSSDELLILFTWPYIVIALIWVFIFLVS